MNLRFKYTLMSYLLFYKMMILLQTKDMDQPGMTESSTDGPAVRSDECYYVLAFE